MNTSSYRGVEGFEEQLVKLYLDHERALRALVGTENETDAECRLQWQRAHEAQALMHATENALRELFLGADHYRYPVRTVTSIPGCRAYRAADLTVAKGHSRAHEPKDQQPSTTS